MIPKARSPQTNKSHKIKWIVPIVACVCVALFFATKAVGTYYSQKIIDQRLKQAGLTHLVHYKSLSFQPLTLTPSLQSVTIGNPHYPWLALQSVSMKWLPLTYPNFNVFFQFDHNTPLARRSQSLLSQLGLRQLAGSGHLQSEKKGPQLTSTLTLNIQQIGRLHWVSQLTVLTQSLSLKEFRSDLLASIALGQLSAMPIIYGDKVAIDKLNVTFDDAGVMAKLFPTPHSPQETIAQTNSTQEMIARTHKAIDSLGLAREGSKTARKVTHQLIHFWQSPHRLILSMTPPNAVSLKDIMLFAQDKQLYDNAHLSIQSQ